MSADWKQIIGSVAPTIATALGGPLAGMATQVVSKALLGKDGVGIEELEKAVLGASPEQLATIKQADNDFKIKMEELGVDLEEIAANDRNSARQREIQLKDNTPKILACVIVTGFFVTLGVIAFVPLQAAAVQPVNILLGALTALLIQVGNYYYGSSAGSARKTEHLASK